MNDVELVIPFKAIITRDHKLDILEEFLLWLEANPEKTHGSGRLVASVCDCIDYQRARDFVLSVQQQGSVNYKAFGKIGSNCSRIVTDTILASTDHPKIRKPLLRNKLFTPSPLGNVAKARVENPIYQVENGVMNLYAGSIFKENLTNYFDQNIPRNNSYILGDSELNIKDAHFLQGIGSSAYFTLEKSSDKHIYEIKRYTACGKQDFSGLFEVVEGNFDSSKAFRFAYDSNCKYCHLELSGKKIKLERIDNRVTNLMQKKQAV